MYLFGKYLYSQAKILSSKEMQPTKYTKFPPSWDLNSSGNNRQVDKNIGNLLCRTVKVGGRDKMVSQVGLIEGRKFHSSQKIKFLEEL